jgi:hypothetical protein
MIAAGDEAVVAQGKRVSAGMFDVLGVTPAIGRPFTPAEEAAGAGRVMILSDGFWKRHYGSAPDVLGKTVRVNDESFTIVGVMPPAFHIERHDSEQVYAPLTVDPSRNHGFLRIVGRLKPGVTVARLAPT